VEHDNSMLVPELWCRMRVAEREPRFLIENGYLEKLEDFKSGGTTVVASRLGYRITASFVDRFLGRIFEMPGTVFPEEMLRPEKQDPAEFAEGVKAIVAAQRAVAKEYFADGSAAAACPPIKVLLHIMAYGDYEGRHESDPAIRVLFTRESLLASDWYRERLETQQELDIARWTKHCDALKRTSGTDIAGSELDLQCRLVKAEAHLARASSPGYVETLVGTIGADPYVLRKRQVE
jgi:phosphoenolpyruvate carboxykinase (diphosphate)